jgi:hypothetical protein
MQKVNNKIVYADNNTTGRMIEIIKKYWDYPSVNNIRNIYEYKIGY